MGIITLKSELDIALRILDYRLSHTTDYITRTIYEYQISFLQHKIEKTYKNFAASIPSPVSVSPNKYASSVVEDVVTQSTTDSAGTPASFVSFSSTTVLSTGVPRSGPAPDVKGGVLNSRVLINGQKFLLWHLVIRKVPPMIWKLVSQLN